MRIFDSKKAALAMMYRGLAEKEIRSALLARFLEETSLSADQILIEIDGVMDELREGVF
jgi:hypothetical protein